MASTSRIRVSAFGIASAYALLGGVYILASDRLLTGVASDYLHYQEFQTLKGGAFIALTALALWGMLRAACARQDHALAEAMRAEDRLRMALDAAGGCAWRAECDPAGGLRFRFSGALAQRLGLPEDVPLAQDILRARMHPDDLATFDAQMRLIETGAAVVPNPVMRLRAAQGGYCWIKGVSDLEHFARHPEGGLSGVAFDITDLQETAQSLADVIAGGELGTWRHDLRSNRLQVNARWCEMLGDPFDATQPGTIADWRTRVHPDDVAAVEAVEIAQFAARGEMFSLEFRMLHRAGHWVWILSRGQAVETGPGGEALVLAGVHIDISRRKALEADLLAKSDFLHRLTETSVSGILAFDASGVVVFANMEAEQSLGIGGAGLLGRSHAALGWRISGADPRAPGKAEFPFARVAERGETLRDLRMTLPRADGEERVISVNAAPMRVRGGAVQVVCSVSDITQRLADDRRLAQVAEEAQFAALHDPQTGLPNRALFRAQLAKAVSRAKAEGGLVMQVFLSIDHFQQIKDRFGPGLADRLIGKLAGRLDGLRSGAQVLARVSAEEFTFLHRCELDDDPGTVTALLERAFEHPFDLEGQPVYLNASLGVSVFPMDAMGADEIWLNADLAMYQAKALGGNQCVQFSAGLRNRLAREAQIGQALQQALRDRAFALVLQPKVALAGPDAPLAGAEALVRSDAPGLAGIGPDLFMPIAERTGLARQIDLIVIDMVGAVVARLRAAEGQVQAGEGQAADGQAGGQAGGQRLRLSVNLSPESLRQPGFGTDLLAHLAAAHLTPDDVLFEITEGVMVDLTSHARDNIALLLARGYAFSADDFGTGYSSLSYLHQLRLSELKIDRSFVARLRLPEGASDAIVRATLAMARALGLRTVAEGVETAAQRDWLRENGCDLGQGYLFGKPLAVDEFVDTLLRPAATPSSLPGDGRTGGAAVDPA